MKCPMCSTKNGLEIDMHADGYADNLLECTSCGAIWLETVEGIELINRKAA
ncbi:MAG TPA: hypothetical protein VI389_11700 [Geobacteraceae bacterium]